jgi:short-subunit dehydrogenase
MEEQVIIVTGSSRGLGAATAKITSSLGAVVMLIARNQQDLQRIAEEISQLGGTTDIIPGDIGDHNHCHRVVDKTIQKFGRLGALGLAWMNS